MMKRLFLTLSAVILSAVIFAGCSKQEQSAAEEAETVSVTHELGTVTVKANPKTIISMDLGIVDALDEVGISVTGLPKQTLPAYLGKFSADNYLNVGSMQEPDYEKINEARPDVIFISHRMQANYAEFAAIAPTIYIPTPMTPYFETTQANIDQLKLIFPDKAAAFDEKLNGLKAEADAIKEQVTAKNLNALILMANDGSIRAYGHLSRFGIIHNELGFIVVDEQISDSTHGQAITFEYIQKINPDHIFVVDRSAAIGRGTGGAQALMNNELVNRTKAAQNGDITFLSSDVWYLANGGLKATELMLQEVKASLD